MLINRVRVQETGVVIFPVPSAEATNILHISDITYILLIYYIIIPIKQSLYGWTVTDFHQFRFLF